MNFQILNIFFNNNLENKNNEENNINNNNNSNDDDDNISEYNHKISEDKASSNITNIDILKKEKNEKNKIPKIRIELKNIDEILGKIEPIHRKLIIQQLEKNNNIKILVNLYIYIPLVLTNFINI